MTVPSVQCLREELRKTLQVVMADAMGLAMRMKMAKAGKAAGRPGSAGAARAAGRRRCKFPPSRRPRGVRERV